MGKSCNCCNKECCLCDKGWNITTWSVDILGKNFNGQFLNLEKPDPFTHENNCHSRIGDCCIIENPVLIDDCRQETDWLHREYFPCCPQCICRGSIIGEGMLTYGYCEILGLLNYEISLKGVTHTRTWQQESYFGVASMQQCCDADNKNKNKTRFIFELYYHVVRFSAQSQQGYARYRTVSWDCLYDPPMDQATFPDNVVRGEWIQPVEIGIYPPCMPCSWPQSTFFGNCSVINPYTCPPCKDSDCQTEFDGSVTLISIGLIYDCDFFSPSFGVIGPEEERICRVTDQYKTASRTLSVASYSPDSKYCFDATIGPNTKVDTIEHKYISECIDCSNIPSTIILNRITGGLGDISENLLTGSKSPCQNYNLPSIEKIIPSFITMNLV